MISNIMEYSNKEKLKMQLNDLIYRDCRTMFCEDCPVRKFPCGTMDDARERAKDVLAKIELEELMHDVLGE